MKYSPTYFLSSLGAGGLAVSFFMYLMFLVPHPKTPIPTFDILYPYLSVFNINSILILSACFFILLFSFYHIKLLIWNTKEYFVLKKNSSIDNNLSLMVIPLTYTMFINVCFILGAIFISSLWDIVEYLFPFSLLGFLISGYFSLKIFFNYISETIINNSYDFKNNNSFSQLISVFCFTMVAVGFAAPGAMSHNIIVSSVGIGLSLFFLLISFLSMIIFVPLNINNILKYGISKETTPTFLIFIPILTLIGISFIRILFGLNHNLGMELDKSTLFVLTTIIFSLEIIFLILGLLILNKSDYFKEFIFGEEKSPLSFALICPGVAFFVFGMFFINQGLVFPNILDKYSFSYFIFMIPLIIIQIITIKYFFIIKNKLLAI